ncbi:MAG: 4Fe-4S dicluster domain-containing protein [Dethiobacteria bacterium]
MQNFEINYGPKIDYRFCKGCGDCYENCPMDVFGWDEEKTNACSGLSRRVLDLLFL